MKKHFAEKILWDPEKMWHFLLNNQRKKEEMSTYPEKRRKTSAAKFQAAVFTWLS